MQAKLDLLPAGCGITTHRAGPRVRFRATRADGTVSAWSGWFPVTAEGEPIVLAWSAFDFGDDDADL